MPLCREIAAGRKIMMLLALAGTHERSNGSSSGAAFFFSATAGFDAA